MDRRRFLASLGAGLLSAPLWGHPRPATAQVAGRARRLIVFFSPNGTVHRFWRPTGMGRQFAFGAGSILEPLAAIKDQLIVVDGLDFVGASNHEGGMAAMLTGGGGGSSPTQGASIDQVIAGRLGTSERFPSLELSVQTTAWGGSTQTRMCYRRAGELIAPSDDPRQVYRRLFGDAAPMGSAADALAARRRGILDVNRAELADLSRKLGTDERDKLEAHVASLRQMEASLAAAGQPAPVAACTAPMRVTVDSQQNNNFPAVTRAQTDLLVSALACGMTRVASLQLSHTVSPTVPAWLNISEGHHSLSHMDDGNTAGLAQLVAAERWFAEQFRYLVERLAALPEPGAEGSMLDHSLVVWSKEMGDSRAHDCLSVPFVLAGRAGGYLSPGQYVRYDHVPHTRLLSTLAHGMGVELDQVGDGGAAGRGPLAGITA
jgi:hypothetical protein